MTELDVFILELDAEMKKGQRAEQALRTVVTRRIDMMAKSPVSTGPAGPPGPVGPAGPAGTSTGTGGITAVTDNTIDVKRDFHAVGDNRADDSDALQAAFTAATTAWGSKVRIPYGMYKITKGIVVLSDNYACMTVEGDGAGNMGQGGGTVIIGNVDDWLVRTAPSKTIGTPIQTVRGVCFRNSSPRAPTDTENTSGGLYIGGSNAGILVESCEVSSAGIGIYIPIFGSRIVSTSAFGPGLGNPAIAGSIGILTGGDVIACKIASWGTGLNSAWGMGRWSNIDLEVCQDGMMVGYVPIPTMNWSEDAMDPAGARPCNGGVIETLTFESCHGTFIKMVNPNNVRVSGASPQSYQVAADYGVKIYGTASNCRFEMMHIGGMFSKAGFAFDTGGADYGNHLESIDVNIYDSPAGVVPWIMPTPLPSGRFYDNQDPNVYVNCGNRGQFTGVPFDESYPLSQAFPSPRGFGRTMVFNDSVDPAWDVANARSNVGKPITGGGSHKVRGMWDEKNWVIAG